MCFDGSTVLPAALFHIIAGHDMQYVKREMMLVEQLKIAGAAALMLPASISLYKLESQLFLCAVSNPCTVNIEGPRWEVELFRNLPNLQAIGSQAAQNEHEAIHIGKCPPPLPYTRIWSTARFQWPADGRMAKRPDRRQAHPRRAGTCPSAAYQFPCPVNKVITCCEESLGLEGILCLELSNSFH
jgi:hypothetical protein